MSEAVRALAASTSGEFGFRDLGRHVLRDFPAPEHLYQLLGPDLAVDFPAPRSLGAHRTNLPAQLTSFVGRDGELAQLPELPRSHRLVTLIGSGGSGKTRLMLEVGAELVGHYADGIWLVELAPITDPGLVAGEVARTLGAGEEPGRAAVDTLIDFLRSKSVMLLLDNCEHLIDSTADLVDRLLASCPGLVVIATSREALSIPGEAVFQVVSLGVPTIAPTDEHAEAPDGWLEEVTRSDSVRLFADRAAAALPTFSVVSANARAVVEICRRLDGIPLAIELAAARVNVLSVDEIARGLGDRFRLLTGGRRTAVPRQQTLQALIDWSWDLLGDADRRLLAQLSVFAGGWTLDAATAVTGVIMEDSGQGDAVGRDEGVRRIDAIDVLSRLVDRSLVVVEHSEATRYRMLETIRQYARDRLAAAGHAVILRDLHLGYFLDLALAAEPALFGADMIPWLKLLDSEIDNLRSALEWSFEADPERALRLSVALSPYWRSRAFGSEAVERLTIAAEVALTRADQPQSRERMTLMARVLSAAANASAVWGVSARARSWGERAVALARETGDTKVLAEALTAQTMVAVFSGEAANVRDVYAEANQLARDIGDWWTVSMIEGGSALGDVAQGNLADAEARLARATDAAARSGNPFTIAFAALSRGRIAGYAGRLPEARHWFREAITAYEQMDDRRFILIARSDLAHALRHGGAIDESEAVYRETLHDWQHLGSRGPIANQLEGFAFIAVTRDQGERAARLFGSAESLRELAVTPMLDYERVEYQAALGRLREQLEPPTIESSWAEGRRLSKDEAIDFALSADQGGQAISRRRTGD